MLKKVTLRNFRTHVSTTVNLHSITLLIGNNNSGKSNLLEGIRHFTNLVRRARPDVSPMVEDGGEEEPDAAKDIKSYEDRRRLRHWDLFPYRYRLAGKEEPMGFSCRWEHKQGNVDYDIDLFEVHLPPDNVACKEKIKVRVRGRRLQELAVGFDAVSNKLDLRTAIENQSDWKPPEKEIARVFFRDLASCWAYHFQPSFLKQWPTEDRGSIPDRLRIPAQLGFEGGGMQQTLADAERLDRQVLDRFVAALRRFEPSFFGINVDRTHPKERVMWQFDLRQESEKTLDEFPPNAVSDGLLKAAAISLLTSVRYPPSLILVEEIENGINPGNIQEFLTWLWRNVGTIDATPRGPRTQCVLTSHSPSVLREFADQLDHVYVMRLDRKRFKTIVTNLNTALEALVGIGSVEGDFIEEEGKRLVKIPRHKLTELWYSGTIG
jgi:predicted ATPase